MTLIALIIGFVVGSAAGMAWGIGIGDARTNRQWLNREPVRCFEKIPEGDRNA